LAGTGFPREISANSHAPAMIAKLIGRNIFRLHIFRISRRKESATLDVQELNEICRNLFRR
jgi:hypothetical protein